MTMPPTFTSLTSLVEVGRGGFGTVYRASDVRFGRDVAVKVIRDAGLGRDVKARFERECLALGHLSGHPNIVAVHDCGVTDDGDLHLIMEFLGGGSFQQLLASRGPADPASVAEWGAALAGALETAHRAGIVHRDVKPENVLFSSYGVPKLVDFGIARMRSSYQTRSGFISATLNHAAPEVVAGAATSPSADVYSLASVLFTMLVGKSPFERSGEESLAPMIARIASADAPSLESFGVPQNLAAVIERGLVKDPKQRYADAAAFGAALADAARGLGRSASVPIADAANLAQAKDELSAEASTLEEPIPGSDQTSDIPRARAATYVPETAPAAPGHPWYRGRAAFIAAAVMLLATTGVAFGLTRSADPEPAPSAAPKDVPSTQAPGASSIARLQQASAGKVTAARTYTTDGENVDYRVQLVNTANQTMKRDWVEVIPKQLAERVKDVSFAVPFDRVVNADPIVLWHLQLAPGQGVTLRWTTSAPSGKSGNSLLVDVRHWTKVEMDRRAAHIARSWPASTTWRVVKGPKKIQHGGTTVPTPSTSESPQPQPTQAATEAPAVNHPPSISGNQVSTGEQRSVSVSFRASDPDGSVSVSKVGGPSWLHISGSHVVGFVPWSAASNRSATSYTVRLRASDGKLVRYANVTVQVQDTHFQLPNLKGKYQDDPIQGKVNRDARSCQRSGQDNSTIWKTNPPGGSIVAYGSTLVIWWVRNDLPDAPQCS